MLQSNYLATYVSLRTVYVCVYMEENYQCWCLCVCVCVCVCVCASASLHQIRKQKPFNIKITKPASSLKVDGCLGIGLTKR